MGYLGVALLTLLENIFPPIPSELVLPLSGYLVSRGALTLPGVIAAGTLGSVLGALLFYWAGRKLGEERLMRFLDHHGRWLTLSRGDIEHASEWFRRHGKVTVLVCRMIPGLRSLISIPAGIHCMPLGSFLLLSTLGTAMWTTLLVWAGYLLGSNFERVEKIIDPVTWTVLILVAVAYLWRVARHKGAPRTS
ncbi:MAG: DedA family protein [Pseudomonadota bacterium]|nr:DedA family protein [Pseudomonadota bacterium]